MPVVKYAATLRLPAMAHVQRNATCSTPGAVTARPSCLARSAAAGRNCAGHRRPQRSCLDIQPKPGLLPLPAAPGGSGETVAEWQLLAE